MQLGGYKLGYELDQFWNGYISFSGFCGQRYPRQQPHCSIELKWRVADRERSRGGHLCSV